MPVRPSRPRRGRVTKAPQTQEGVREQGQANPRVHMRPADNSRAEPGLVVRLSRKAGVTKKGLLGIPYFFQVPPLDDFTWEGSVSHAEYDTISTGQYSRAGGVQLRTVTFNTLMVNYDPAQYADDGAQLTPGFLVTNVMNNPYWLTEELNELMRSATPFWLSVGLPVARGDWDLQILATLRTLRVTQRAGEPDSMYTDVSFTEWRRAEAVDRRKRRPTKKSSETKYVRVTKTTESTLAQLAQRHYGDSSRWRVIAQASGISWVPGKSLGQYVRERRKGQPVTLKLPPKDDVVGDVLASGAAAYAEQQAAEG